MIGALLVLAATLAAEPRVTLYPVPDNQIPTELALHGKELWFVSWANFRIEAPQYEPYLGRIDSRGTFTMKQLPAGHMPGFTTHAPDGTMWLSDAAHPVLWRVTKDGKIDSIKSDRSTQGIAFGPDGALWTTSANSPTITRFAIDGTKTGSWDVPEVVMQQPMTSSLPGPRGPTPMWIVAGPDGALWFTDPNRGRIGRIDTKGQISMYRSLVGIFAHSEIMPGPDGALWYGTNGIYIGRITTKGEVMTTRIALRPTSLALDPQGRIWFAEGNYAGFIDKELNAYDFPVPGARNIRSLAAGPDGAMWFADQGARAIGRIELLPVAAPRRP